MVLIWMYGILYTFVAIGCVVHFLFDKKKKHNGYRLMKDWLSLMNDLRINCAWLKSFHHHHILN